VPTGPFDTADDLRSWYLYYGSGYEATASIDTGDASAGAGSVRIDIDEAGGTDLTVKFRIQPVPVRAGEQYTLTFWAKSDRPRAIRPWVQRLPPYEAWVNFAADVELTTSWQRYEMSATAKSGGPDGRLVFPLGQSPGSVWLDQVMLQRGSTDVWRRDFEGGVALVNATASSVTVPLGEILRKIDGGQVPALNDGSLVARVILPPRDGLVLVRTTDSAHEMAILAADQLRAKWQRCVTLCRDARAFYAHRVQTSSGPARLGAVRARLAWDRALAASRTARTQATACQGAIAEGELVAANTALAAHRISVVRAWEQVKRAWRMGHASGSHATAARRSAAVGRERCYTARIALTALTQSADATESGAVLEPLAPAP
jgi:hypothetical protein